MKPSDSRRSGRARLELRPLVVLVLAVPLWVLLLGQSFKASWSVTQQTYPSEPVARFEPIRSQLANVSQADFLAGFPTKKQQIGVFWQAQFVLTPTVLSHARDTATVLKRMQRQDPHFVVTQLSSHEEFLRFARRYERRAEREGRVVHVLHLNDGIGLLESRSEE